MYEKENLACHYAPTILRSVFLCFLALASPVCSSIPAQQTGNPVPVPQSPPDFRISSGKDSVTVPFDLFANTILLRARINDSRPVWLIFDTGAGINVINQRIVESLGLTAKGAINLSANGGTVGGAVVEGATIRLPGAAVSNQRFAALPLESLSAYFGRDVQGILGSGFIQNFVVEIDYARRILTFHDPKTYHLSGERDALELVNRGGTPYVQVTLSLDGPDTATDLLEIDTGSNAIFSINRPFAETHQLLKARPRANTAEDVGGAGLGGDQKYVDVRINSLQIGKYILKRPVVSISQDTKGFAAGPEAGFIGTDLLRRFTVILDYQSHRMLLRPNAQFREPFEVDMSGLELITQAGDRKAIQIKRVRAHFPAAEAGLHAGDVIVAVNGRPAAELGLDNLTRMFKQAGKEYLLTVRQGHQTKHAKLRMRRVI